LAVETRPTREINHGDVWTAGKHVLVCGIIGNGFTETVLKNYGIPVGAYLAGITGKHLIDHLLDASFDVEGNIFLEVLPSLLVEIGQAIKSRGGFILNNWCLYWQMTDETATGALLRIRWRVRPPDPLPSFLLAGPERRRSAQWALTNFCDEGDLVLLLNNSLTVISAQKAGVRSLSIDPNGDRLDHALTTLGAYHLSVARVGNLRDQDG
jgi:hypothetical protein